MDGGDKDNFLIPLASLAHLNGGSSLRSRAIK